MTLTRSFALACSLTAVVSGCGAVSQDDLDYNDADALAESQATDGKADGLATTSTFYTIEHDARRCVSPLCGGYWLKRVNRKTTRCSNGRYAERCYVAEADTSALVGVDFSALTLGRLVVRAKIDAKDFEGFGNLGQAVLTEAWTAPNDTAASGTYYRLTPSPILCITTPCPSIHQAKLNSTLSAELFDANLDVIDATQEEIDAAAAEMMTTGILAAGSTDSGEFEATQFFTRVTAPPKPPCKATGCSGQICADSDVITTCEWKPEYACYQAAACERQADGACGWTKDAALDACLNPPSRDVDLGALSKPGAKLAGSAQEIPAGWSLKLQADRNQLRGITGFEITPAGILEASEAVVRPSSGALGSTERIEYAIKVPAGTAPGTVFDVKTLTPPQSASDPNWAFSFQIVAK